MLSASKKDKIHKMPLRHQNTKVHKEKKDFNLVFLRVFESSWQEFPF